jgi:hypothetical protein
MICYRDPPSPPTIGCKINLGTGSFNGQTLAGSFTSPLFSLGEMSRSHSVRKVLFSLSATIVLRGGPRSHCGTSRYRIGHVAETLL